MNISDSIYKNIADIVGEENIFIDEPMKKHTSIRVGGNADVFVKANTIEKVKSIYSLAKKQDIKLSVLGNGTNVLVKDNGIRGIVLKVDVDESFIPITLICEGKILKENLALSNLSEDKVKEIVKKQTSSKIKDVLVLTIEQSGDGYIQLKSGEGKSFQEERLVAS